jgi:hypothetical protein
VTTRAHDIAQRQFSIEDLNADAVMRQSAYVRVFLADVIELENDGIRLSAIETCA